MCAGRYVSITVIVMSIDCQVVGMEEQALNVYWEAP